MMRTAERLKKITATLKVPLIFKSSFSKDNRSSLDYYQGPGLDEGLRVLEKVKREFELPLLTDIHYPYQAAPAAEVVDVLQIPAYLCMQSELVVAAAKTGAVVNIKHGQFIAPDNMAKPVKKIEDSGNDKIIVTERGYTFGYNDLIVDPRSFLLLAQIGYPVVFDITPHDPQVRHPECGPARRHAPVPHGARALRRRRRRRRSLHRGASEPARRAVRRREPVLPRRSREVRAAAARHPQPRPIPNGALR